MFCLLKMFLEYFPATFANIKHLVKAFRFFLINPVKNLVCAKRFNFAAGVLIFFKPVAKVLTCPVFNVVTFANHFLGNETIF